MLIAEAARFLLAVPEPEISHIQDIGAKMFLKKLKLLPW